MKARYLVFIFVVTVSYATYGQETVNNFEIEQKEVVWRKVVETTLTFDQLVEKIKNSGLLDKIEIGDNQLAGDFRDIAADFKGAGFSEMGTPMYIARSHFNGFAIIEYKEGRYRVTLKKIILVQKYDDGLSKQGERTNLDVFALKTTKDKMKGAFKKSPSLILDYTFTDKFTFKDAPTKKDW